MAVYQQQSKARYYFISLIFQAFRMVSYVEKQSLEDREIWDTSLFMRNELFSFGTIWLVAWLYMLFNAAKFLIDLHAEPHQFFHLEDSAKCLYRRGGRFLLLLPLVISILFFSLVFLQQLPHLVDQLPLLLQQVAHPGHGRHVVFQGSASSAGQGHHHWHWHDKRCLCASSWAFGFFCFLATSLFLVWSLSIFFCLLWCPSLALAFCLLFYCFRIVPFICKG